MPASYTNRAGISVTVQSTDLTKVNRQLKTMATGKPIRRALNKRLKEAAKPVAEDVKRAARAIPTKGTGSGKLRRYIADNVKVRVSQSSVRITAEGSAAKYMEGVPGYTRWRHPVFGNTDVWVQQPSHPFFYKTADAHRAEFDRAAEQAMDDALKEAGIE